MNPKALNSKTYTQTLNRDELLNLRLRPPSLEPKTQLWLDWVAVRELNSSYYKNGIKGGIIEVYIGICRV